MEGIPVACQSINPDKGDYVADTAAHAWYENANMNLDLQLVGGSRLIVNLPNQKTPIG